MSSNLGTAHSRTDAREHYHRTIRVVRSNTGGPDQPLPALAGEPTVVQIASGHGRHNPDAIRTALTAAVENSDLVRVRRDGANHYAVVEESSLVAIVEAEVRRDDPDRQLVAGCNELLEEARS